MPLPLDPRYLELAEQRLGMKLPDDYKLRMLRKNGGELLIAGEFWDLFPVRDESSREHLRRTCNDLVHETASARACRGFPNGGVAIGEDGCGNYLVLLPCADGALGDIPYAWDHETAELTPLEARGPGAGHTSEEKE